MILVYHKGQNFGDTLNKYVLEKQFPNAWQETDVEFWGIGSILGLNKPRPKTNRVVVFSSGYAPGMSSTYGEAPNFDHHEFDFRSIRGPITKQYLPQNTMEIPYGDGGLLVSNVISGATVQKGVGLMPHLSTELRFPKIKSLCEELNIKYISPSVE